MACITPSKENFNGTILFSKNWPGANIARIWPSEAHEETHSDWAYSINDNIAGVKITGNLCLGMLVSSKSFHLAYNLVLWLPDGKQQLLRIATHAHPQTWPIKEGTFDLGFFSLLGKFHHAAVSISNLVKTDNRIDFTFTFIIDSDSSCIEIGGDY